MSAAEESVKSHVADEQIHEHAKHARAIPRWLALTVLWSALGPLSVAYSVSVIASSLAQPTFLAAFKAAEHTNINALTATVGAIPNMGGFVGQPIAAWFSDHYGRKKAIVVFAGISVLGQVLSGGSAYNWGMLIFARFLTGFGGWPLAALVVTYQSELSITEVRGFIAALVGISIGVGYSVAAWVGLGIFYYHGISAWRVPLLVGAAIPLAMVLLSPFVPESPRWLCFNGRNEEAKAILYKMHKSDADPENLYADEEYRMISAQAQVDASLDSSWLQMFRKASYRKRALISALVATAGQVTGIQAVTTYGPSFYAAIGYGARDQILLSAGWITIAPLEALILQQILDKVGRRPLLWLSSASSAVVLAILAALTKEYGSPTAKESGQNSIIAFIYIFILAYMLSETPQYVFYGEAWPTNMRAKGTAFSLFILNLNATWITYSCPWGLADIGYKYYFVYMSLSVVCAVLLFLYLPETKGLALEKLGAVFGDGDELVAQQAEVRRLSQAPAQNASVAEKAQ